MQFFLPYPFIPPCYHHHVIQNLSCVMFYHFDDRCRVDTMVMLILFCLLLTMIIDDISPQSPSLSHRNTISLCAVHLLPTSTAAASMMHGTC